MRRYGSSRNGKLGLMMNYDDLSLEYPMESTTLDAPVTLGSLMAAVRAMAEMDNEALLELVSEGKLDKVFPYQVSLPEKAPALERWNEVMQQGDSPQPKQGHHPVDLFRADEQPRLPREGIDLKEHLSKVELRPIRQALDDPNGVVKHTRAAKRLGMWHTSPVVKIIKYSWHLLNKSLEK